MPAGGEVAFIIVGDVTVEPTTPPDTSATRVYMLSAPSIFKSTDLGQSWSSIYNRVGTSVSLQLQVIPGTNGDDLILVADMEGGDSSQVFLAFSSDGGQNWTNVDGPWPATTGLTNLAGNVSLISAAEWVVRQNFTTNVYRTVDSGANWTLWPVLGVAPDGVDSGQFGKIWLRGGGNDGNGFARCDPDGSNLENPAVTYGVNINRTYGISAACGLYTDTASRTTRLAIDDGMAINFTGDISPTGSGSLSDTGLNVGSVWTDDDGTTLWFYIGSQGAGSGQFWKSTDGGANWTKLADLAALDGYGDIPRGIQLDPNDSNNIFLVTGFDNKVLVSNDGGVNWSVVGVTGAIFPTKLWAAFG